MFSNNKETSHKLTNEECARASNSLLKNTQTEHFFEEIVFLKADRSVAKTSIGDEGLLRVRCRVNYSDLSYDEKFPILLPKCHLSLLLVRDAHLKFKHADVNQMVSTLRNQYWVIGFSVLAKIVKAECLPCKRLDAKACQEPIAPLMEARLKQAPPFHVVGTDFAGPIYCRYAHGQKFYVLLFTSADIKAVHLKLVEALALSPFLLAFQRFVARRGMSNTIFFRQCNDI